MNIMDIQWSENQRRIIESDEKRILVSASAGSGKTTVMIARILRLILKGHKLENMLICTFTRAAASDMRTKLYRELTQYYGSADCNQRELVKAALKSLSRADISTIDSFCQRFVAKYFYLIGIDPQFEVLGDESYIMKTNAVKKAVSKIDDEAFCELRTILKNRHSDDELIKLILFVMERDEINIEEANYRYDENDVARRIELFVARRKNYISNATNSLFAAGTEPEKYAEMRSYLDTGIKDFSRKKFKDTSIVEGVDFLKKEIGKLNGIRERIKELVPQSRAESHIRALCEAVKLSKTFYSEEKQRRSAVDFADLERYALEILKIGGSEVRKKYNYVFVDEYQDINPLQEQLISTVSKDAALFMVGDIKQSIYAFRGCEPMYFKRKYDAFSRGEGGTAFDLNVNYRSGKKIISFVNSVFSPVMTEKFGSADYKSNLMTPHSEKDGEAVLHQVIGKAENEIQSGIYSVKAHSVVKRTKKDAAAIIVAKRVVELIESGADFGDIAILSRRMKTWEKQIADLLRDMNIPVSISERAYYLKRAETGRLISFLKLIDSRRDEQALMISMLSPFGGFDENELAALKLDSGGTLLDAVEAAASSNEKVRAFLDKLDRYTQKSKFMEADELSDMIVSECGYFNYAYSLGEASAEALDKFLEFLCGLPCKGSLYATLKYIDDHNPFTELSGEENAVKIMTVHASKGLEFKHVLVVGFDSFTEDKKLPIAVKDGLAMEVFADHKSTVSDELFLYRLEQDRRQREEDLRILYVALTRAKESLDVFVTLDENDKFVACYGAYGADMVDFSLVSAPSEWLANEIPFARRYNVNEVELVESEPRKVLPGKADDKLVSELKAYFEFKAPPSAPAKSYVSKLAHGYDEPNEEAAVIFSSEDENDGDARERGNAYHRALEKLDFASPDLSVIGDDRKLIDDRKLLLAAKNMSRFTGKVYKEKPFMIRLKAKELGFEGDGYVLVQGVIDLLIIDGDRATIVDYKTGKAHGKFESGYFRQVDLYAEAVRRLLGKSVASKWLYYIDEQIFVEVK